MLVGGEGGDVLGLRDAVQGQLFARECGRGDQEVTEERVRAIGSAPQLGMELAAQHERVICQLGDLHQSSVGRRARKHQPSTAERLSKVVVELIPMPMAFKYDWLVVCRAGQRAGS